MDHGNSYTTYFKLSLLPSNNNGHNRQTILALLQIQFQFNIIRTSQSTFVDLFVNVVVLSMLLDGCPGVGPDSLLNYYIVGVLPPLLDVLGKRNSRVEMAVFSRMKILKLIY